jgi:lactoylglutathione lyase
MNVTGVVPFLGVTNMEQSLHYYVDGLGFSMKHNWVVDGRVRWCWLTLGGAAIMLQEFRPDRIPSTVLGLGMSLNFQCEDAIALYREFTSRGLAASEPQVGNSLWEFGLTGPDGYRIRFASPTDLPEETLLSQIGAS